MPQSKRKKDQALPEDDVLRGQVYNVRGGVHAQGDVILGSQYLYVTQYLAMPAFAPPVDLEGLRAAYLEHLRSTYRALDFKGVPQFETVSRQLQLEDVYVPLLAQPDLPKGDTLKHYLAGRRLESDSLPEDALAQFAKAESPPQRVEEALGKHAKVIVLGDPGSGKTTLIKYLALRLAAESGAPLPILLPLNAYAGALAKDAISLQDYLPRYFAGLARSLDGLEALFDEAIQRGQAVILLDGLDEVQDEHLRSLVKQRVEACAAEITGRGCKLMVTSRIVGYRESPLRAQDWAIFTLLDFTPQAVEDFSARWCLAFEKSVLGDTPEARRRAEIERASLLEALQANPGVQQLASNPLLLTILALIKRHGVSLPNRRVELYELYLKTLITTWIKAKALDRSAGGKSLDYLQTISVLGPLALRLRKENPTAGLVVEERLLEWLTEIFTGEDWGLPRASALLAASEFLHDVRLYSNLLVERGQGRYGFIHLTFEEALAARGVVQKGQLDWRDSLPIIQDHLPDPAWRETILLAVGVWGLVREQPRVAGEVVKAILKDMDCAGEAACQNVLLAGRCLEDVGERGVGPQAAEEVIQALLTACANRSLPPRTQREAGFCLGRLAGGSPEMLVRIRPDLDKFVQLPGGEFQPGEGRGKPLRLEAFAIARYPVTNLQFRRFVQAGGYSQPEWWSETGWAWRSGTYDSRAPKEYQDWLSYRPPEKRGEPYYWHDERWNNPLAPVVGVSGFEAEAYASWLSQEKNKPFRLPTEWEWEYAAGGAQRREYAWGSEFDPTRLNCAEFWAQGENLDDYKDWEKWFRSGSSREASTTLVGQFPEGGTPEGVYDLSGNTWEWTDSWYEQDRVNRVLRGGAWYDNRRVVRCASRGRDVPDYFINDIGFRLVSPGIFLAAGC